MRKADLIALLLEDMLTDEVRVMSAGENIDEFDDPDQLTNVSHRIVGVNNGGVDGTCLILTNATPIREGIGNEEDTD